MPIKPLFNPECFETNLARARRILNSWTSLKRLSSADAEIIVRMIAQGIAEGRRCGLELAESECPTDGENHLGSLKDSPGAKS
jgi:hypothetical protein